MLISFVATAATIVAVATVTATTTATAATTIATLVHGKESLMKTQESQYCCHIKKNVYIYINKYVLLYYIYPIYNLQVYNMQTSYVTLSKYNVKK